MSSSGNSTFAASSSFNCSTLRPCRRRVSVHARRSARTRFVCCGVSNCCQRAACRYSASLNVSAAWSGECLCSLVRTQNSTVLYVDSPELVQLMKVDDFHQQGRSGQGVAYSSAPDLARFPQINAPDSNGKILQHSGVSCGTGSGFVKIRLTSGPNKRKAGWVCEAGLRRTAGGQ